MGTPGGLYNAAPFPAPAPWCLRVCLSWVERVHADTAASRPLLGAGRADACGAQLPSSAESPLSFYSDPCHKTTDASWKGWMCVLEATCCPKDGICQVLREQEPVYGQVGPIGPRMEGSFVAAPGPDPDPWHRHRMAWEGLERQVQELYPWARDPRGALRE